MVRSTALLHFQLNLTAADIANTASGDPKATSLLWMKSYILSIKADLQTEAPAPIGLSLLSDLCARKKCQEMPVIGTRRGMRELMFQKIQTASGPISETSRLVSTRVVWTWMLQSVPALQRQNVANPLCLMLILRVSEKEF